jgi:hypothetical protein
MNRQSLNWEVLTDCQKNHGIYKAFIVNYIQYICAWGVNNYCDNLEKRFLLERYTLRNKFLTKDVKVDNRTSDMCTWLYVSFTEFLKYALAVQAINQEQHERYTAESFQIFLNVMEAQAERMDDLDDVRRFFRGLLCLLDAKEVRIGSLQARNSGYASEDSKSAIGFSKSGLIWLKNDVAFHSVVTYFKRFGRDFVISESTLRKMLNDKGYLIQDPGNPKSPIHRLSVNQEHYQCIRFEESKFYKLLEGVGNDDIGNDKELQSDRLVRENANVFVGRGN